MVSLSSVFTSESDRDFVVLGLVGPGFKQTWAAIDKTDLSEEDLAEHVKAASAGKSVRLRLDEKARSPEEAIGKIREHCATAVQSVRCDQGYLP